MAMWSRAHTVSDCSNTGIMGSNPVCGLVISVLFFLFVFCVSTGLAEGQSLIEGLPPIFSMIIISEVN
jgi:hypothetical protein